MAYQQIEVKPLTGALGAEIEGVDLSQSPDEETISEIHAAWLEHQVLFFRDQELTPEQHLEFAGHFGEFQGAGYMPAVDGYPDIYLQRYPDLYGGIVSDITWHIDASFLEVPLKASALYALEVPAAGGDTTWTNLYAAYDALSIPMQGFLSGLHAVHDNFHAHLPAVLEKFGAEGYEKARKYTPPWEHPIVCTHPETGRKLLFISELMVSHIAELSAMESKALLAFLLEHIRQPEFQCRFRWRRHSLAFWDNRCTAHKGIFDFGDADRLMHRVALRGDASPAA